MPLASPRTAVVGVVLLLADPAGSAAPRVEEAPPAAMTVVEIAARIDRGLVHLELEEGYGTGFLYRDPRTIVTAAHVVLDLPIGGEVVVRTIMEDEEGAAVLGKAAPAILRFVHPEVDLAVLEWTSPREDARVIEPSPSPRLLPRGTEVLVHGFPGAAAPTLARGIVSAHQYDFRDGATSYLLDAAMGSGGSGGPVTDLEGRLVGVANAVYDDGEASNFNWVYAIPARWVESIVPAGGVAAIPAPRSLAERVASIDAVREGGSDAAVVEAIVREIDSIATATHGSTRLRDEVDALLDAVEAPAPPTTIGDAARREEIVLALSKRLALRMATLAMREFAGVGTSESSAVTRGAVLEEGWTCTTAARLRPPLEDLPPAIRTAVLDRSAQGLRELVEDARRGCASVAEYLACPSFEERRLDRAAVLDGYGAADLLGCAILEGWAITEAIEASGAAADLGEARSRDRFEKSVMAAQVAWLGLPPACRDVRAELDGLEVDELRSLLEASGFRRIDATRVTVDPESPEDPRGLVEFSVESEGVPSAIYLLASPRRGGEDEVDIDLVLRDRGGFLVDADERGAAGAAVALGSDEPGPWTLEVIDPLRSGREATVEFWALPRAVRIIRASDP